MGRIGKAIFYRLGNTYRAIYIILCGLSDYVHHLLKTDKSRFSQF